MSRVIRENRNEEDDLAARRALVAAEQAERGNRAVIQPYYPRADQLGAGDPKSESGIRVSFNELDDDLQALLSGPEPDWAYPVQTIQNLRDVPPNVRKDKQMRLVEDAGAVYRFDTADTTTPDDGNLVIAPTNPGTPNGRWFKTLVTPAEFAAHVADASAHHARDHAATHQHGGLDEVATATPAANAIPKAGAGSTLDAGWMPDATEDQEGVAEVATQPETDTGTDDARIVTPKKLAAIPRLPSQDENDALQGTNGTPSNANRYVTNTDPRLPSQDENDALQGTNGTPSTANRYVTNTDPRNTDARTPLAHATSHQHNGTDEVAVVAPAANAIPKAGADARLARGWLLPDPASQPDEWATFRRGEAQTTGSISASTVQYSRVWLSAGTTITDVRCHITGGGSATRLIRFGLYNQATPTSPTGTPNNKVAETAQVDTNTTGDRTVPLTASYAVPTSGYYWIAFICTSVVPSFRATGSGPGGFWPLYFESSAGTTLPATTGTLTQPTSAAIWAAAVE